MPDVTDEMATRPRNLENYLPWLLAKFERMERSIAERPLPQIGWTAGEKLAMRLAASAIAFSILLLIAAILSKL